jgi:uncharacterized protein (TIGR02246 family)
MLTDNTNAKAEADIRARVANWEKAFHAQDIDAIMGNYAPDVLAFDAIGPSLQIKGRDAYRKHWEMCMSMCNGPVFFEMQELEITAADTVAFGHYVCECGGTNDKGETETGWMRVTICFQRQGEQWLIAHEHFSSPFDPATGKTIFDAKP